MRAGGKMPGTFGIGLDEIQREYADVAWLREQHAKCQERLDELEKALRGAPDNLDVVLQSYQIARLEEAALLVKLDAARLQGTQLEEAISSARDALDACVAPSLETVQAEQERLRAALERAENDLTSLLRGRVDLIRQREGMQLQIQRDFPLFHEVHATSRAKVDGSQLI